MKKVLFIAVFMLLALPQASHAFTLNDAFSAWKDYMLGHITELEDRISLLSEENEKLRSEREEAITSCEFEYTQEERAVEMEAIVAEMSYLRDENLVISYILNDAGVHDSMEAIAYVLEMDIERLEGRKPLSIVNKLEIEMSNNNIRFYELEEDLLNLGRENRTEI